MLHGITYFKNYWNFDLERKHNKDKTAFRARKVTGTFGKQAPGDEAGVQEHGAWTADGISSTVLPQALMRTLY